MPDKFTPAVGSIGTFATFTLGEINSLVGIGVGLLTGAYLIRKHMLLSQQNKDDE